MTDEHDIMRKVVRVKKTQAIAAESFFLGGHALNATPIKSYTYVVNLRARGGWFDRLKVQQGFGIN